jgi:hypothetical protein
VVEFVVGGNVNEAAVHRVLEDLNKLANVCVLESNVLLSSHMSAEDRLRHATLEASASAFVEAAGLLREAISAAPDDCCGSDRQ